MYFINPRQEMRVSNQKVQDYTQLKIDQGKGWMRKRILLMKTH